MKKEKQKQLEFHDIRNDVPVVDAGFEFLFNQAEKKFSRFAY